MAAYVLAEMEITDPKKYDDYRRQVLATLEKHGGRFLVRGGRSEGLEGGWQPSRLVVLEFPSYEKALAWYRSPEYTPLAALRQEASRGGRLCVVGGV